MRLRIAKEQACPDEAMGRGGSFTPINTRDPALGYLGAVNAMVYSSSPPATGSWRSSAIASQLDPISAESNVAVRMDRLPVTRLHLTILFICACGFTFDLLEITLGSGLSAVFSAAPHKIDPAQLSWLIAAVYLGAIVGAPALGWLGDRLGRKTVLMGALFWIAASSIVLALREDILWLTCFRLIAGLALGAYPPLMFAYLTDLLPPAHRGRLILILCAVSALGPPTGFLLLRYLTPLHPLGFEAWRWLFVLGGIGAACSGMLFLRLPESPRWLMSIGRIRPAEAALARFERSKIFRKSEISAQDPLPLADRQELAAVARSGATNLYKASHRFYLLLASGLFFLSPWATTAFPLLSGPVFLDKGVKLSATLLYLGISTLGQLAGMLLGAVFADRIQRRDAIVWCAVVMAVGALMFAGSREPLWLILSNLTFSVAAGLFLPALTLYVAELFPTGVRSSGLSVTWAINRVGSVLALLVLVPMLRRSSVTAIFAIIALTLAMGIGVIVCFGPRGRAGRSVD
jgi:MFS transporter, putative metabolite:H+ symporter